jgi:hypothetical protein
MAIRELHDPSWIKLKGALFFVLGSSASLLLLLDRPAWRTALLLVVTVWGFCRFYYFAFYVLERYVDSSFRYAGMISMVRYLMSRREQGAAKRSAL